MEEAAKEEQAETIVPEATTAKSAKSETKQESTAIGEKEEETKET
jgi:hypothetical protein